MKNIIIAIAFAASLTACASDGQPEIQTQIVKVAVPVACKPANMPPRPALLTKDQIAVQLAATPLFDDRVRLLTNQLLAYMGWVPVVEGALSGCVKVPSLSQQGDSAPHKP